MKQVYIIKDRHPRLLLFLPVGEPMKRHSKIINLQTVIICSVTITGHWILMLHC